MPSPLVRLVRMTLHPDSVETFLRQFDEAAPHIRATPGCLHLELWRDARFPNVVTTYSHWRDAEALDAYRHGELFRATWAKTKPLFAAAPVATSHHALRAPITSSEQA